MGGALQIIMSMLSLTQTIGIEGNQYVAYGISKILYSYKMMDCIYRSIFNFNIATVTKIQRLKDYYNFSDTCITVFFFEENEGMF